jgi:hypothetical protein
VKYLKVKLNIALLPKDPVVKAFRKSAKKVTRIFKFNSRWNLGFTSRSGCIITQ